MKRFLKTYVAFMAIAALCLSMLQTATDYAAASKAAAGSRISYSKTVVALSPEYRPPEFTYKKTVEHYRESPSEMGMSLTESTELPIIETGQQSAGTPYGNFSAGFGMPAFTYSGTALSYTAGTIYAGGTAEAITASGASPLTATTSEGQCTAPFNQAATACNFVYWTSGTGLSITTSYATAYNGGQNVIVAYVTTSSTAITGVTPASLTLPPVNSESVTSCGTTTTCTQGNAALLPHTIIGTVTFSAATTATITAIAPAFTSTTSYTCTASDPSHGTYTYTITVLTSASFTITAGTSNSDAWAYQCRGY